jgi:hypothetical protein
MRKVFIALLFLMFSSSMASAEVVRQKNAATYIQFNIWKNDGTLLSGAAGLDSEIDTFNDGAAPDGFTDCTNEATEIGSTGQYYLSLSQAEMNADYIVVQIKSSTTGAVTRTVKIMTMGGDPFYLATGNTTTPIENTGGKVQLQTDQAVNTTKFGGTTVTGRDIGSSVLLSSGTGTGQLDITSGVVKANLAQILGTALTETSGYLAAGFKQFFNIASPTSTMNTITTVTTATTATTCTNLTNAPTNGDLTATMKTSVTTAATAATPALSAAGNTAIMSVDISAYTGAKAGTYIKAAYDKLPTNYIMGSAVTTAKDTVMDNIKTKTDYLPSVTAGAAGGVFIAGSNAATSITTALTANIIGNVTGNLSGSVGSVSGAVGSISGITFPTNFNVLSISATTGLVDITQTAADKVWATAARILTAGTNIALAKGTGVTGFNDITAANVWDTNLSGYSTASLAGTLLKGAGSAGDPWSTAIPGAYGAGTAGKIIGDNLNAPVATVDTVVDAIKAKTDSLTFTGAGILDSNVVNWKGATAPAMTGDAYARLGAPAGASVSADVAAVKSDSAAILVDTAAMDTNTELRTLLTGSDTAVSTLTTGSTIAGVTTVTTCTNLTNAPTNGDLTATMKTSVTTAASAATPVLSAAGVTAIWDKDISAYTLAKAGTYLKSLYDGQNWNVWDDAARTLTAGTNIALAKGTGITGFNDIAATDVWAAATRTLTSGAAPSAADIWAYSSRTLTGAGSADWTADERADILAALGITDGTPTVTIDTLYQAIKVHR